ncbi:hypothetical protein OSTOST_23967, partial [Ostertagia ostertagi]
MSGGGRSRSRSRSPRAHQHQPGPLPEQNLEAEGDRRQAAEERRARIAARARARRQQESDEQRRARLDSVAGRVRARRQQERDEEREDRRLRDLLRARAREDAKARRNELIVALEIPQRATARRGRESEEERADRRLRDTQRATARRGHESEEERADRRRVDSQRARARRDQESDEQRRARLESVAGRARARRMQRSQEQHERRIAATSRREQLLGASSSEDEVEERRRIESQRHRKRAGRIGSGTRRVARSDFEPEEHYDGPMNVGCGSCGARHFSSELRPGSATFNDCCNHGCISLEHFTNFPLQLRQLLTGQNAEAKEFREHIRNYNSAFAFASIGAQLDTPRHGPYCFRIHGQIYHKIGPARPEEGQPPRYGQVYILDTSMAAEERAGNPANIQCNRDLIRSLSVLLHGINRFARAYKMLNEVALEEEARAARERRSAMPVKMVFRSSNLDPRRYNEPTANEVAVVYVGEEGDVPTEHNLAVHLRSGGLRNIRVIDAECDPLSYPILFPRGEPGWHPNMQKTPSRRSRTRISQKEYYSHMVAVRDGFNPLHFAGKLFQQFLVDCYVRIEQNRLNYDRTHQTELRVDTYRGLTDYVAGDMDIEGPPGARRIILPSSFPGSPRAMMQSYQDAMAIVSKFGKPDLFVTFTSNPAWKEITEQLSVGQTASDRPDIVARVFHIKLQELFTDLLKRHIFGKVIAYISVMEWQKRGLPHCHILLTMAGEDKLRTAAEVDSVVQAVIPDPLTESRLHRIVTTCMMHRPCGIERPNAPCMVDGKCSKKFPKQFRNTTNVEVDGYPEYRRPNDGRTVESGGSILDNRSVVPYNRYLALKYNAHLNVEICGMIHAVKYMYKYVYKGPDRAALHMTRTEDNRAGRAVDEIDAFVNARYIGGHLPGHEIVMFQRGQEEEALRQAAERDSTLTAFFKLNAEHEAMYGAGNAPQGMVDARTLFYVQ